MNEVSTVKNCCLGCGTVARYITYIVQFGKIPEADKLRGPISKEHYGTCDCCLNRTSVYDTRDFFSTDFMPVNNIIRDSLNKHKLFLEDKDKFQAIERQRTIDAEIERQRLVDEEEAKRLKAEEDAKAETQRLELEKLATEAGPDGQIAKMASTVTEETKPVVATETVKTTEPTETTKTVEVPCAHPVDEIVDGLCYKCNKQVI